MLIDPARWPRAARYNPEWVCAAVSGGAHPLMLTEWLIQAMDVSPGDRVLDLGAGRGASSVFLARELNVEVWSVDLWFDPRERQQRAADAGVDRSVHALRADARALPFPTDYFDAVLGVDCFPYFGTDDLFLGSLARHLRPGGQLGIAGAALTGELGTTVPEPLRQWWEASLWSLHSAPWWRDHWSRTGLVEVHTADAMGDGWQQWLAWQRLVAPGNTVEIDAVVADAGATLTYGRVAGRRTEAAAVDPITTISSDYVAHPVVTA